LEALQGPTGAKALEARTWYDLSLLKAGRYPESIALSQELIPKLRQAGPASLESFLRAEDVLGLGYLYDDRDQEAHDYFETIYKARLAELGAENPSTLIAQRNLYVAKRVLRKLAEPDLGVMRKILETQERVLGKNDPEALETKFQLAFGIYRLTPKEELDARRDKEIRGMLKEVEDARIAIHGEIHPDVSEAISATAFIDEREGKLPEAIKTLDKVSSIEVATLGPDHPWSVNTYLALAMLHKAKGDYQEALAYLGKALNSRLAFYGGESEHSMEVRHMEAELYFNELNDPGKALEILQTIFEWKEKNLGPDNASTLRTLLSLADLQQSMGKLPESEGIYNRLLDHRMASLGPDHGDTLQISGRLAFHQFLEGNIQKAQELFEGLLEKNAASLGPDNDNTLDTQLTLGAIYSANKEHQRAKDMLEKTLASYERLKGPEAPQTLLAKGYLVKALRDLGETDRAISLGREVLEARERNLGPDSSDTAQSRYQLAGLLMETKDYGMARHHLEKLVATQTKLFGKDDARTLTARLDLASAYRNAGLRKESKEEYLALLKDVERVYGGDAPLATNIRNQLALVF
jgi:tetratricopeptide (TPR) repeat protein